MRAALVLALVATTGACASAASTVVAPRPTHDDTAANAAAFAQLETHAIDTLAAVDPRLARRFGVQASPETMLAVGMEAVQSEDASAAVRGGSFDLFAFKARAATLAKLAAQLAKSTETLPDAPRLERELLVRAVAEEVARVEEERPLADAAAPLVRAIVDLWTPGKTASEWGETDSWVAARLLQIRSSYANPPPPVAASDLEPALFELERLLTPMQFGKSTLALTQLRETLDKDHDGHPDAVGVDPKALASRALAHLGVNLGPATAASLATAATALEHLLEAPLAGVSSDARDAVEKEARALLFADATCPPVAGSPMRSAAPPPERAAVCNVFALALRTDESPAVRMALHDEIIIAAWALAPPPPHSHLGTLSFRGDDEVASTFKELAASRPLVPLAAGLAAALIFRAPADAAHAALRWQTLGEAPLDIAERELASREREVVAPTRATVE